MNRSRRFPRFVPACASIAFAAVACQDGTLPPTNGAPPAAEMTPPPSTPTADASMPPPSTSPPSAPDASTPPDTSTPPPAAAGYVAHEWGTFTSVQASDGRSMEGLLHEDEPPPAFVYERLLAPPGSVRRAGEPIDTSVNQRMETPVIYFYSETERSVHVDVSFPTGIVTEWFPDAVTYAPLPADSASPAPIPVAAGTMSWDVDVVPDLTGLPQVDDGYFDVPARNVASTPIRHHDHPEQRDRMIFYRGVANFETALSVRTPAAGSLELRNSGDETIPAAFLLQVDGTETAGVTALGAIAPGARTLALPADREPTTDYVADASTVLAAALRDTGLYADEAQAMVDTWSKSYFLTPGVRVLYVLPRAWTDGLLPLKLDPAPTALVRTLVGRIEVLTPDEESALATDVAGAAAAGATYNIANLGSFGEPKLRRALELMQTDVARAYTSNLIQTAIDTY